LSVCRSKLECFALANILSIGKSLSCNTLYLAFSQAHNQ
jgi:hypothetical protein